MTPRAERRPTFLTGTLYSLQRATSLRGERGSVGDSTRSEMEKVVPSTKVTRQVSDLGPESWTREMDLEEVRRMESNSSEDTEGMEAAWAV